MAGSVGQGNSGGRGGGGSWKSGAPPPGLERGGGNKGGQQHNHQRKSSSNSNNNNSHSKQGQGQGQAPALDGMTSRLRFIALVLVGHKVQVQVKSGVLYEGILHTMKSDPSAKDFDVVLLMAEKKCSSAAAGGGDKKDQKEGGDNSSMEELVERPVPKLVIHSQDVIQLTAKSIQVDARSLGPVREGQHGVGHEDAGGFGTDSSISRGKATGYGRKLEKWEAPPPSAEDEVVGPVVVNNGAVSGQGSGGEGMQMQMEGGGGGNWDQFAAFERMTGAKTTYTEETYTTALNKNDPRMRALEAQAARIAREIEGQTSSNFHVAEERGHRIDDSGMDEEDRYSGVQREPQGPSASQAMSGGSAQPASAAAAAAAGSNNEKKKDEKKDEKKKSGLNVNAKPFSFNANAKAFVPGARKPAAAPAQPAYVPVQPGMMPGMMPMYRPGVNQGMYQYGAQQQYMQGGVPMVMQPNPYNPYQQQQK